MTGFYGADLAWSHHDGYGDVARAGAETLRSKLRAAGRDRGLVVDLGAGSGIAARVLADAGFEVLGFDISADMVALAREHAPSARFEQASVWDVEIPPCVAIVSLGEVLSYAADPRAGRAELARLLARAHAALVEGGVLVFDVMVPTGDRVPKAGGREGDGWVVWGVATEDPAARTLERRIVLFRRAEQAAPGGAAARGAPAPGAAARGAASGALYRRTDEVHLVRLYEPGELLDDLAAAGFSARQIDGYAGTAPFRPGVAGFVARTD